MNGSSNACKKAGPPTEASTRALVYCYWRYERILRFWQKALHLSLHRWR
jgi:hypothetical protein